MNAGMRRYLSSADSLAELTLQNVEAALVTYQGRWALRLVEAAEPDEDGYTIAMLAGSDFQNGMIETEIAGDRRADAPAEMRGFVGLAFRVQDAGTRFECFWIRPTNGRADDQVRRNHATQYASYPDYPWHRLRTETPGLYESYTDLVPGAWTKIKIEVQGVRARLYVHGAEQPCLIVNDLKMGDTRGQIALWIGAGTEAHFSKLVLTPYK